MMEVMETRLLKFVIMQPHDVGVMLMDCRAGKVEKIMVVLP